MDIFEVNRDILDNIRIQYPESVRELSLEGKDLVFRGERCDISQFNLYDLLSGDSQFANSLSVLSSEDVFRIIRLHTVMMNKTTKVEKKGSKEKIEFIKNDNPLMKSISIVERPNGIDIDEFINIVDSRGENHLYRNETNVDIFAIYEMLKMQKDTVTPDDLIAAIDRRLYEVRMSNASDVMETSKVSEDFSNKLKQVNDPYKTNNGYRVSGNEQDDIAIVTDLSNPQQSEIKTFDQSDGDLVINSHNQNVSETTTTKISGTETSVVSSSSSVNEEVSSEKGVKENKEQQDLIHLMPLDDFFRLYSPSNTARFSEEERKSVNLYYAYFGDLILYEDYLLPELREILNRIRNFVIEIEINLDSLEQATERQRELINKRNELEEKKNSKDVSNDLSKEQEYVKKLMLEKPNESGSISTLQVLVIIVGIAIILTAITLAILG